MLHVMTCAADSSSSSCNLRVLQATGDIYYGNPTTKVCQVACCHNRRLGGWAANILLVPPDLHMLWHMLCHVEHVFA
jgi:hypothetical protein